MKEVPSGYSLGFHTVMNLGTEVTPEHIILWTGKEWGLSHNLTHKDSLRIGTLTMKVTSSWILIPYVGRLYLLTWGIIMRFLSYYMYPFFIFEKKADHYSKSAFLSLVVITNLDLVRL